jgi:uncharacterized protein (TIGR00251 family)
MLINIKVITNSSQEKVEKIDAENYKVWIKEKPIEGKANVSIVKLLKRFFNADKVQIKSGLSSRKKIVEIKE